MVMLLFFFKQKTAYEMRISDWSSDVCSSVLAGSRPCAHRTCSSAGRPARLRPGAETRGRGRCVLQKGFSSPSRGLCDARELAAKVGKLFGDKAFEAGDFGADRDDFGRFLQFAEARDAKGGDHLDGDARGARDLAVRPALGIASRLAVEMERQKLEHLDRKS